MKQNRKGEAGHFTSKAIDQFADDRMLSELDDTSFESVKSIIDRMIQPNPKVIRLYRCFYCNRCLTARKMSVALILCRICYGHVDSKGRIARRNLIDKTLNNIHRFLRARIDSI